MLSAVCTGNDEHELLLNMVGSTHSAWGSPTLSWNSSVTKLTQMLLAGAKRV